MKPLRYALLIAAAGAAAYADFPEPETAERLFLEAVEGGYGKPEGAAAGAFIEGETPDQALAPFRLAFGFYDEVYLALFVRGEEGWRLADSDGPFNYMPEFGGDAGTIAKVRAGDATYYQFTYTEASYGSGMGTEYDYLVLYRLHGEELREAFESERRVRENFYARWYGGEDSSAWTYGGAYDSTTEFTFDDVDGDGRRELWAVTRETPGGEDAATYFSADLYAADAEGNYAPANLDKYREVLESSATPEAKLTLGRAALAETGDAASARAYYEEAATLLPEAAPGLANERRVLDRLADDPPEAVRLYYEGGSDKHRLLLERYPNSAAAAEAVVLVGELDELLRFLKRRRDHPHWPRGYALAVREALYNLSYEEGPSLDLKTLHRLKKDLGRYLEAAVDVDARAGTLTHLADCYYHLGEYKTAARLYENSLAAAPEGVFLDYNYLRLGDCAAAVGDHDAAIGYYLKSAEVGGWWGFDAADMLTGYSTLREGSTWRHFLDFLDDHGSYNYLTLEIGDLNGDAQADFAALVQWEEGPHELYYFLREGDEFRGELVTRGRPSLWFTKIQDIFEAGPALLVCRETVEDEEGRRAFEIMYRFDGSALREVGRVKIEDTGASRSPSPYHAEVSFAETEEPGFVVTGTATTTEGEQTFEKKYLWNETEFAFEPAAE